MTLLDRFTRRCDIACATDFGNHHPVLGVPFSMAIGSWQWVAVRHPAGGNRDNLTGVCPDLPDTTGSFRRCRN
jgi:hypothetical protein